MEIPTWTFSLRASDYRKLYRVAVGILEGFSVYIDHPETKQGEHNVGISSHREGILEGNARDTVAAANSATRQCMVVCRASERWGMLGSHKVWG